MGAIGDGSGDGEDGVAAAQDRRRCADERPGEDSDDATAAVTEMSDSTTA
jgi:hypothetical protein